MDSDAKLGSGEEAKTKNTPQQQEEEHQRNPILTPATEQVEEEQEAKEEEEEERQAPPHQASRRTPFTNLSQVDADLALARTLQEQETAYMMLRMNNEGSDYGSWDAGSYLHDHYHDYDDDDDDDDEDEEDDDFCDPHDDEDDDDDDGEYNDDESDAFDVAHTHTDDAADNDNNNNNDDDNNNNNNNGNNLEVEFDPAVFSSDEAYARALQDAEEREMASRLLALAGINDRDAEDTEDHGGNTRDTWEELDPDELSYEELLALGEVVGTESRGLAAEKIASLPSIIYKSGSSQNGSNDSCVICRLDYEDGETLTVLSCKHSYHSECIHNWLKINKVCPVCSAEVSVSGHS